MRGWAATLGVVLAATGCGGPFPDDWTYVSRVTSTGATIATTGGASGVSCRNATATGFTVALSPRARGLRVARVEGLTPATAYVCRIAGGTRAPVVRFRTAPAGDMPFTFAAVGDTGDGSHQAAALARRILAGRPAFLIHLGDLAYPYGKPTTLDERFFAPYRRLLARVPLFPTPGNHDLHRRSVYRQVFAPVADGETEGGPHYAFDWGPVHVASVSSPQFSGEDAAGARWLADDLARAGTRPWRIVFLHEPPFDPGTKVEVRGLRRTLEPILEAGRVELLLAGHVHLYQRTLPACVFDRRGNVLQVVSGGGGANLDPAVAHPNFPRAVSATHYLRVRVTPDTIDVRAIDVSGRVLDRVRRRRGEPEPCRSDGWPAPRGR